MPRSISGVPLGDSVTVVTPSFLGRARIGLVEGVANIRYVDTTQRVPQPIVARLPFPGVRQSACGAP